MTPDTRRTIEVGCLIVPPMLIASFSLAWIFS